MLPFLQVRFLNTSIQYDRTINREIESQVAEICAFRVLYFGNIVRLYKLYKKKVKDLNVRSSIHYTVDTNNYFR